MKTSNAGSSDLLTATAGAFCLIDNWRVALDQRDQFLDYYIRNVAKVIETFDGYLNGRVLVSDPSSSLSWHVQALYEFETDDVLDHFHSTFDRQIKRVNVELSLEKVLDGLDPWVLAHEDGTLTEVWCGLTSRTASENKR